MARKFFILAYLLLTGCLVQSQVVPDSLLTIKINKLSLENIFTQIENQSDYRFSYISDFLPDAKFSLQSKKERLFNILTNLLSETELNFTIDGRKVNIYRRFNRPINPFNVYGKIISSQSGESLIGSNIFTNQSTGTSSNAYGFYSIQINPATDTMVMISYIGYLERIIPINKLIEGRNDIDMEPDPNYFGEIVVRPSDSNSIGSNNDIPIHIPTQNLNRTPSIAGNGDVLEYLNTQAGIVKFGLGKNGYSVEGSTMDQNLIIVDEAPIYNPSHTFGFLSIFNQSAINSITFDKTYISPNHGGRLASVLDIHIKEGNSKKHSIEASTNPFFSGLTIDGPIITEKASFLISGRKSHINWLLDNIDKKGTKGFYTPNTIDFYDFHGKLNVKLSKNDQVFVSTLINQDAIVPNEDNSGQLFFSSNWENKTFSTRWNRIWSDKIFSNLSFYTSEYTGKSIHDASNTSLTYKETSQIKNNNIKFDVTCYANNEHQINAGFQITKYDLNPAFGTITNAPDPNNINLSDSNIIAFNYALDPQAAIEHSIFFEDKIKVNKNLEIFIGVRQSGFSNIGTGHAEFDFDENGNIINGQVYKKGAHIRTRLGLEPRFSINYIYTKNKKIKFSYTRSSQYISRLFNENPNQPSEIWIVSGKNIVPMYSNAYHYDMDLVKTKKIDLSFGLFQREAFNISTYKEGANLFTATYLDQEITQGNSKSIGGNITSLFSLREGDLSFTYTFMDAKEKYKTINNNEYFTSSQGYKHVINASWQSKLSEKLLANINWQYRSGDVVSVPTGVFYVNGFEFKSYDKRNNYQLPAYHRLDIALNIELIKKSRFKLSSQIGIYNAYGRVNPFQVRIQRNLGQAPDLKIFSLTKSIPFFHLNLDLL